MSNGSIRSVKPQKKRAEEEEKEKALRSTSYDLRAKHLQFHNSEKIVAIDKDNQLLLDKLVKISRNGKAVTNNLNKTTIANWATHPGTLNTIYRKKELEKIAVENEAMAKRLISQHGSFDRRWLDTEFSKHLGLLKKVQKMPSPGLEKLSSLRSPMSAGNVKEFKIKRKRKNKRRAVDELGSGKSVQDVEPIKEVDNTDEEPQAQTQRKSQQQSQPDDQPTAQNEQTNVVETQVKSRAQVEAQNQVEEDKSKRGSIDTQQREEEKAPEKASDKSPEKSENESLSKSEVKEQLQVQAQAQEDQKRKSTSQEPSQVKTEPQEQKKNQLTIPNEGKASVKRSPKKAGTILPRQNAPDPKTNTKKRVSSLSNYRHGSATSLRNEVAESRKQEAKQEERIEAAAPANKEEEPATNQEAQEENKNVNHDKEEEGPQDDADAESEKVDIPEIEESSNSQDDIPASSDRTQQQQAQEQQE